MRAERRALAAAILAACLSLAAGAHAEPDVRARASASFDEGRSAFARRDYEVAALAFERAAELVPHPKTWLNAAEAWEERGDALRAVVDCDRALSLPEIGAEVRREAEARRDRLVLTIATLDLRGPPGLRARVDDEKDARPLPRRVRVLRGDHRLSIVEAASGRERQDSVFVNAGDTRAVDVDPFAPSGKPPSSGPPTGAIVAFSAAAVLGVGSAVFGILTLAAKDDYDEAPSHEALDAFVRSRTITNVTLGAALVSGALGAALWIFLGRTPPRSSEAALRGRVVF